MERLTFEGNFCGSGACSKRELWERLKAYEDTGLTPSEALSMKMDMAIINAIFQHAEVERMKELAEADKDGRLVVLPCKVGDTVYIHEYPVTISPDGTKYYLCDKRKMMVEPIKFCLTMINCKSKFWVTREEAEAALREAKKDG